MVDTKSTFLDFFTTQSQAYAEFRPIYPKPIFDWLAHLIPDRQHAWDCATGNGQAAVALADYFAEVTATDGSHAQIAKAIAYPRVTYREALATKSGLPDNSVNLVTVAQALHWFATEDFYSEVRRVLKKGGVLAAWCYGFHRPLSAELNQIVDHFAHETLRPYWAENNRLIWNGYRDLYFPFERIAAPAFSMSISANLRQFVGLIDSWSATAKLAKAEGSDPFAKFCTDLAAAWGDPQRTIPVDWDITLLAARI